MDLTSHVGYARIWGNPRQAKIWIEENPAPEGCIYLIRHMGNSWTRIGVYDISTVGEVRFLGLIPTNHPHNSVVRMPDEIY